MAALSTLAYIGIGLSVAKMATDYVAQRRQATNIERQGDFEAMLFGRNADAAEREAQDALARGRESEMDIERNARLLAGGQRAAFGASGIAIDQGSPVAVMENDSALAQIDRQRVRVNAAREAAGYLHEAESLRMQGDFTRRSAKSQARSLRNQSVVTLLTGVGEIAASYRTAPRRIRRSPIPTGGGGYGAGEERP